MTAKKFLIENSNVETYYEEHIKMMEDYAQLKVLEKLEKMAEEYPDHYGLYQVLEREILTLKNKGK